MASWDEVDRKRRQKEKEAIKKLKKVFRIERDTAIEILETQGLLNVLEALDKTSPALLASVSSIHEEMIVSFFALEIGRAKAVKQFESFLNIAVKTYISQNSAQKVGFIQRTSKKKLSNIIELASAEKKTVYQVKEEIQNLYLGFSGARALTIAATEVGSASSYGQFEAGRLSGAEFKIWSTAKDAEVRPSHQPLNGQKVKMNALFSNGLRFPLDPAGSAAEIINCRCSLSFA